MARLKDAFSRGITSINVKTNEFVEESKINTHISTLNSEIKSLQATIGAIIYGQWKENGINLSSIEPILAEIDSKNYEIDTLKHELYEVRCKSMQILGKSSDELEFCPKCGNKNQIGNVFCTVCGSKLTNTVK